MLIPLEEVRPSPTPARGFALFETGFRIFFALAGLHAVVVVALWAAVLFGFWMPPIEGMSIVHWHAHEMIFGYSLAVIAGFLLTAAGNWTGRRLLHGWPLALLASLWLLARILFTFGFALASGVLDLLFVALLSAAVIVPIARARQRRQTGIMAKLVMFLPAGAAFTFGAIGAWAPGTGVGITAGLYLVVGLILMMGRRVVPVFIKSGVPETFEPRNSRLLDITSLVAYLVFFIALFWHDGAATRIAAWAAGVLFVANAIRLAGWHTPGIWRRPLVWVLFVGMSFVTLGFALHAAAYPGWVAPSLAAHAFAYGGIGLMTLGMMARVSLGHSGRSIHDPPAAIGLAFGSLAIGAGVRVLLPIVTPASLPIWLGLSQILWIAAFTIFTAVFLPMLARARVDGRPG